MIQVGVEEPAQVAAAGLVGDGDEFPGAAVARREVAWLGRVGAVDHAARGAEEGVVADQLAQRVQDQRALGVDVVAGAAPFILVDIFDALGFAADHGHLVEQRLALGEQLGLEFPLAAQLLQVQRLHVAAEAFVQPHIVPVGVGHLVAEPFVRQLVVQQPVVAERRLGVAIAIGVDGLVLHAQVRGFDHAHFLVAERIGADAGLEEIEHRREFGEQALGLLVVSLQVPHAQRDLVAVAAVVFAGQHIVGADVEGDAVGAGVLRAPVVAAPAVLLVHAERDAVAGHHQRRRHADVQVDQFRLALRMVDAGPEQVAAFALDGGGDPRLAVLGLTPHEGAIPRRVRGHVRHAVVADAHGGAGAGRQRRRQGQVEAAVRVADRRRRQLHAVHAGVVDRQVAVELDRDAGQRRAGQEGQRGVAADAAAGGIDAQRQVGALECDGQLFRRARAAGVGGEVAQRQLAGGATGQQRAGGKVEGQARHRIPVEYSWCNIVARITTANVNVCGEPGEALTIFGVMQCCGDSSSLDAGQDDLAGPQRLPVLNRFADVRLGDALGLLQVGDGAGHAQNAVVGAAGPLEVLHRHLQARLAGLVRFAVMVDFARAQVLVALALALQLDVGGGLYAGGDQLRRFAVGVGCQDLGSDRADFHLDVDAIEQRTGDAALVAHRRN